MHVRPHSQWRSSPLAARGHLFNALAGLESFLAFTFLALGLYLINNQFADPLRGAEGSLIIGALFVATALALVAGLFEAGARHHGRGKLRRARAEDQEGKTIWLSRSEISRPLLTAGAEQLFFRYADSTRIRVACSGLRREGSRESIAHPECADDAARGRR